MTRSTIHALGVPEGGRNKSGPEEVLKEIMVEYFPNSAKDIDLQIQEAE